MYIKSQGSLLGGDYRRDDGSLLGRGVQTEETTSLYRGGGNRRAHESLLRGGGGGGGYRRDHEPLSGRGGYRRDHGSLLRGGGGGGGGGAKADTMGLFKGVGARRGGRHFHLFYWVLSLYSSFDHFPFSHLVWHFCHASDRRILEHIQEKALRAIFCDKTSSYDKLLVMANLCTLQNRRLQDLATLMYKVKHNICPKYVADLFQRSEVKYALHNKEFVIPRFKTVTYRKHWA